MITEDYVSFEVAKLLKEKGFDGECRAFWKDWKGEIRLCSCNRTHIFDYSHNSMLERYNDTEETNIAAPTLQMAMKWLREVHKIEIWVHYDIDKTTWWGGCNPMYEEEEENSNLFQSLLGFDYPGKTYEEACEAAIKYCLENLI